MSEDERMDRARRLRELREARRAEPAEDDESSPTDEEPSPTDEAAVADAVDRIAGAKADVPSPDDHPDSSSPAEAADAAEAGFAGGDEDAGGAETRVLEFTLGEERYCIDIAYVEEIVPDAEPTRVPNTPEFVEGVVDLRGQVTTILNPKVLIGAADVTPGELLVVFDGEAVADGGHLGWVVDDVRQVAPVSEADLVEPPGEEPYVEGVVDREDDESLVVWTSPAAALEDAT